MTISAPTSAGKSYALQYFMASECASNANYYALYIVPTRALINQVSSSLNRIMTRLGEENAVTLTIPTPVSEVDSSKIIYVLTQERLQILLEADTGADVRYNLLVIDESQIIADDSRGVVLQTVVEKVLSRWAGIQVMFASPSTENPEILPEIFGLEDVEVINERECPVTQNLISLDISAERSDKVDILVMRQEEGSRQLGTVGLPFSLYRPEDMLSYLTWMFGRQEKNLTYASTPSKCENVASKIGELVERSDELRADDDLHEFAEFVREHIHPDYVLAEVIEKGVGFHYGNMPTLVRRTIERLFEVGQIDYLVCTSTLLHGVNLPAKNMFMLRPSKGRERGSNRDIPINSVDFWNLSGRAGRLGKDFDGNVFLINHNAWELDPLKGRRQENIQPSLSKHLEENTEEVIAFISDRKHIDRSSDRQQGIENTFVKLFNDYHDGILKESLNKFGVKLEKEKKDRLFETIEEVSERIDVPIDVLRRNITISPFRQQRMFEFLLNAIKENGPDSVVPVHPLADGAYDSLASIFRRIDVYFEGTRNNSHRYFTQLAFRWMRGDPLRRLIDYAWQRRRQKAVRAVSIGPVIRGLMENIEQGIRFRYLRYGSCYIDLLKLALIQMGHEEKTERIPAIPLYLELGACSDTMVSLIGLGLSRITASILADKSVNKDMDRSGVVNWLKGRNLRALNVPYICIKEVEELLPYQPQ